jgi:hypothetical protein
VNAGEGNKSKDSSASKAGTEHDENLEGPDNGSPCIVDDVRIVDLIMALLQKIHSEKQHQDASGRDKLSHPQSKHAS